MSNVRTHERDNLRVRKSRNVGAPELGAKALQLLCICVFAAARSGSSAAENSARWTRTSHLTSSSVNPDWCSRGSATTPTRPCLTTARAWACLSAAADALSLWRRSTARTCRGCSRLRSSDAAANRRQAPHRTPTAAAVASPTTLAIPSSATSSIARELRSAFTTSRARRRPLAHHFVHHAAHLALQCLGFERHDFVHFLPIIEDPELPREAFAFPLGDPNHARDRADVAGAQQRFLRAITSTITPRSRGGGGAAADLVEMQLHCID